MKYNNILWDEIVNKGRKKDSKNGIANKLSEEDVGTIIATMEFFNASKLWIQQSVYDLLRPRYRVFDWLAMCVMGRNDDAREINNTALKVLIKAFIDGNYEPQKFIDNLRVMDYDVIRDWENINIDIEEEDSNV